MEPFARQLLDENPTVEAVILVTREITLDRDPARLLARLSARDREHRFESRSV